MKHTLDYTPQHIGVVACADPGAALVEGYPFGPPPSAVLVSTRRTARYLQLEVRTSSSTSLHCEDVCAMECICGKPLVRKDRVASVNDVMR